MSDSHLAKQRNAVRLTVALLVMVVASFIGAIVMKFVASAPKLKAQLEELNVLMFDSPRLVPEVSLIRHDGEAFQSNQFAGQWNVINFGYTYCPDICPTNMADMNMAYNQLQEAGLAEQVSFWMVTVDAARDTVEQLAQYVPYFNSEFVGLTGDNDQIATLAMQLSVVYYQEGQGDSYTVAHSDNYAIIDPNGHFIAMMRPPHKPSQIAQALTLLMNQ